ncbi:sodium channel and clathrin linker 1 isoform X2 [Tupaia chinensis]|uniref:sodium channel and clathrin linker 1 isoform X2 n=1 Tax=Tupaia chinensis TaxID=246437 RepID=UPI0007045339|nr:sodium channel and clathrin linker 1 isoform X2 [Tupaia chinensis]
MATEIDFLRDQNQRLNEVLRRYQMENFSKYSSVQKAVFKGDGDDILENSIVDQSFLAPLITEYDKHLEELNGQLKYYQKQVGEMKLQLETVIKENERLHSELKDAVEKQLEALPFGTEIGDDAYTDDETVKNLREQLQLANQEKTQAVELWQTVSQELDRLQKLYQEHMTEAQIHVIESKKQKDQLTNFQQLTKRLHVTNENIEMEALQRTGFCLASLRAWKDLAQSSQGRMEALLCSDRCH